MSVLKAINDELAAHLKGNSRLYGKVEERFMDGNRVNVIRKDGGNDEVVAIDDGLDNLIFYKVTGESSTDQLRFTQLRVSRVEMACYCKDGCNQELIESLLARFVRLGEVQNRGVNENGASVLRDLFLIDDPSKVEGFNPDYYAFSFGLEIRTPVRELCC